MVFVVVAFVVALLLLLLVVVVVVLAVVVLVFPIFLFFLQPAALLMPISHPACFPVVSIFSRPGIAAVHHRSTIHEFFTSQAMVYLSIGSLGHGILVENDLVGRLGWQKKRCIPTLFHVGVFLKNIKGGFKNCSFSPYLGKMNPI